MPLFGALTVAPLPTDGPPRPDARLCVVVGARGLGFPMTITLRPYQSAAVERIVRSIASHPIVVSPTGSGKTVICVAAAQRIGVNVLWVAHRRELVTQAAAAVRAAGGRAGVIMASADPEDVDPTAPFQVGSVQTIAARGIPHGDWLLVIDEAHHATSASYKALIARCPRRFGCTATPFRLDGKGLRSAGFDEMIVVAHTDELCADGTLHPPIVYAAPSADLRGVRKTAGDYNLGQLGAAMRSANLDGRIVETWKKRAEGRRTVAFAVDVAHGGQIVEAFTGAGIPAEIVTGATPKVERAGTLARLAAGVTKVVVNCQVLTEGWDLPALEVAIMARPTASLCLHLQMIGRIMRACEGKDDAIVLDHAGNYARHGLVTDRLVYSLDDKVRKQTDGEAPHRACPECAKVVPAAARTCPACGYEFPQKNRTEESDVELLPVGHKDTFAQRSKWWEVMRERAAKIVRSKQGGGVFAWDEASISLGRGIAYKQFKARYGELPLVLDGKLIDPETATESQWALLRAEQRRWAIKQGWYSDRIEWFVRGWEERARGRRAVGA